MSKSAPPADAPLDDSSTTRPPVGATPTTVPILLDSIRAQRALDVIGIAALAAGAAALLSISDALVVTVSVAAVAVDGEHGRAETATQKMGN